MFPTYLSSTLAHQSSVSRRLSALSILQNSLPCPITSSTRPRTILPVRASGPLANASLTDRQHRIRTLLGRLHSRRLQSPLRNLRRHHRLHRCARRRCGPQPLRQNSHRRSFRKHYGSLWANRYAQPLCIHYYENLTASVSAVGLLMVSSASDFTEAKTVVAASAARAIVSPFVH